MGVRERVSRLLDRGHHEVDPERYVYFAVVRVGVGPMLVARLQRAGIEAIGEEAFNPGTQVRSDYRVKVRRRDLGPATAASTGDSGRRCDPIEVLDHPDRSTREMAHTRVGLGLIDSRAAHSAELPRIAARAEVRQLHSGTGRAIGTTRTAGGHGR